MCAQIRIGIAEDHIMLRAAMAQLINKFDNCQVILEACNGKMLQEKMKDGLIPDILLLDLQMPVMNGFEAMKWLASDYPNVSVIIVSMFGNEIGILNLLKAGARAFLKKNMQVDELKSAIYAVHSKGYYYTDCTTRRLLNLLYNNHNDKKEQECYTLSEREICFLQFATTDMTYKEISNKMNTSMRGVDKIRDRLFIKLNAKNRVGLSLKAIFAGIISFPD